MKFYVYVFWGFELRDLVRWVSFVFFVLRVLVSIVVRVCEDDCLLCWVGLRDLEVEG